MMSSSYPQEPSHNTVPKSTSSNQGHIRHMDQTKLSKKIRSSEISIGAASNIMIGDNNTITITSRSTKRTNSYEAKELPAKHPITTSQQALSMDQKLDIKDKVGRQWKDLGRRLDLGEAELEQLEMEAGGNYSEVIYQILTRWEQRSADLATQETLARVFVRMKRGDLADLLHT